MPPSMAEILANIIASVGSELEQEPDAMRRMALTQCAVRLTEGLWWLNSAVTAGRLIQRP